MGTLASAIAEILRAKGCHEIYGIGGDYAAGLIQALHTEIELCPSSSEVSAGYAACASAEINGLGCCLATFMVGSIPCLAAAALAVAERLPVIFLSGAPTEQEICGPVAMHHSLCRNDSTTINYQAGLQAFRALGIAAERLTLGSDPVLQFFQLVEHAVLHRQPVFVEIPRDLPFAPAGSITHKLSNGKTETAPSTEKLLDLAGEIEQRFSKSYHPLIFYGDRLKHNPTLKHALLEFCRSYRVPYMGDACSKGIFAEEEALNLGICNPFFTPDDLQAHIEEHVDFVIEVATPAFPRDICNLGSCASLLSNFKNKIEIKWLSDDEQAALLQLLCNRNLSPKHFSLVPAYKSSSDNQGFLNLDSLLLALDEYHRHSAGPFVYIAEIGSASFASLALSTRATQLGRGWLSNPWYGAMGTALPYARAVCRKVKRNGYADIPIVLIGDGGFHLQLNELAHFQRERLRAIIILLRNNEFALGKASNSAIYQCCDESFDTIKLIEAYGGEARRCTNHSELKATLQEFTAKNTGVQLIEIPIGTKSGERLQHLNDLIKSKAGAQNGISPRVAHSRG